VPLPRKFINFSSQNGVIWCILGVLFLRFMCPMQWRSQEIVLVGANSGDLGDRSPPVRSRSEAPVWVWGQSPQTLTTLL